MIQSLLYYHYAEILSAFEQADKDNDGFLSMEEYVKVFRSSQDITTYVPQFVISVIMVST